MPDVPFWMRAALVLAFLTIASAVELAVRGRAGAIRWRASLVIVGAAALGGALGLANDTITVAISPEYFAIGKQLGWSDDLPSRARALGLRAGISAGTVLGCVLAHFAVRHGTLHTSTRWSRVLGAPILTAIGGAVVLGGSVAVLAPNTAAQHLGFPVAPERERAFVAVLGAHLGLYVGAVVGVVRQVRRLSRMRSRSAIGTA